MKVSDLKMCPKGTVTADPPLAAESTSKPLHRIQEVRLQQGVSLRGAARRMGVGIEQVRKMEDGSSDMPLTTLYQWQSALEVPVADLLVDTEAPLSEPVMKRARLLRLMKTAAAIRDQTDALPVERLAQMLVDQLVEIMPELEHVSAWPSLGQRRTLDEVGRIAERPVPDQWFQEAS